VTVECMDLSRTRHPWYDVGLPVLAGLVCALGVVAAYRSLGLFSVVAAFVLVELTVAPTAWSIVTELGKPGRPAVLEVGPACALGVVVLMGLVSATGAWSLAFVALVVLTSPLMRRRGRQRLVRRYGSDRAETLRAFDEIVAHGWTAPFPEDDADR
jgi:hypothetical protein